MIKLQSFKKSDISELLDTSLKQMSQDEIEAILCESTQKLRNGKYYEWFSILNDNNIVGFISIYAHSKHIVWLSFEIKPNYRRKGYALAAIESIIEHAKALGYTMVSDSVLAENKASIVLHERLGFEFNLQYNNEKGNIEYQFLKSI